MTRPFQKRNPRSKRRPGQLAGRLRPAGRSISPILLKFIEVFADKTALELAIRTGADVRHCERCLAGQRDLGSAFLQQLLRSDFGSNALDVIMTGARQPWWLALKRQLDLADAHRAHAAAGKLLDKITREVAEGGE